MRSTETWRTIFRALPDASIGVVDGEVSLVNALACELFGTDAEPLPALARLFPNEEERLRLTSTSDTTRMELQGRGANGEPFLAEVSCRPDALEDGRSLLICSVRAMTMSKVDQERYRAAFDLFELGLFDHNQVTDELWGSSGHRALYGVTPDEVLTIPRLLQGLHPEDFGLVAPAIAAAHDPSGDGRFDVEHRVIWPDGRIRWIRTLSQTYFGEVDGEMKPVRTVGASADQTARKEAERERERIASVLEESPDFVAISAPDCSLLYLNRSARLTFEVDDDDDLSKKKLTAQYTDASCSLLLEQALPAARRDGVWSGEVNLLTPRGREIPVSLVVLAHYRADDSLERYATIARDLSREKELEEQLLHSQKMEALGRVAGGAAHDFNNLLSVIIAGTDYSLSKIREPSVVRQELCGVMEAAKRATELTRQMLTFSRKSLAREGVVVDVNDLITRMMPILTRLVGKRVELVLRLTPEPGHITADPSQIEQVVLNLVVNARDAMPKGGTLTVATRNDFVDESGILLHRDIKPGAYVVLEVSDNGTGMDAETKAHIFEPFFTTKELEEGTGLGLSTVFGIVKQSGGAIRVKSELGYGSTFEVSLPRIDAPETSAKIAPDGDRRVAGTASGFGQLSPNSPLDDELP